MRLKKLHLPHILIRKQRNRIFEHILFMFYQATIKNNQIYFSKHKRRY